jgi:phytoene/squalene synthetase
MTDEDLARGLRLLSARQQADSVVLAALLTTHAHARLALDHLNRLADADSEDAERNLPQDEEMLGAYRERLAHWIGLVRRCASAQPPSAKDND